MKKKWKLLLWLAGVNLFISAFTFGGGYIVVPMIRKYFVEGKGLFSEEELAEMAAVAQSSPGAIAINLSVLAGNRAAGAAGAAVSGIFSLIPPILILSLVSRFYTLFASNRYIAAALKGMEAGVAALIVDLVLDMYQMIRREKSLLLNLLVPVSFVCSFVLNINAALILAASCIVCVCSLWIRGRRVHYAG